MPIREQLLAYRAKVQAEIERLKTLIETMPTPQQIIERLLRGELTNGSMLPVYKESTLQRKKSWYKGFPPPRLYGNGVNWSLKDTGNLHSSIQVLIKPDNTGFEVKADIPSGLRALLAEHGITVQDVLGGSTGNE